MPTILRYELFKRIEAFQKRFNPPVCLYQGITIKTYLSNYPSRVIAFEQRNGGGSLMRIMEFNRTKNTIKHRTFVLQSTGVYYDGDAGIYFTMPM